ncbi:hypothetical protein AKJ65_04815 [candidate division MSBL1 archaeon SCGC-AAA259E19]|uniref:Uncharacterized protein n=1 Tax=candidate division MSBL1 archaeon SCGC-AAA259E19 TaxID=1698264 RepID=A0A133UJE4_9EURY|nr:hypothetical protein AKJ65_04815 [candidate division MSBL1 archaeon SCGC-AAA259E19]
MSNFLPFLSIATKLSLSYKAFGPVGEGRIILRVNLNTHIISTRKLDKPPIIPKKTIQDKTEPKFNLEQQVGTSGNFFHQKLLSKPKVKDWTCMAGKQRT